MIEWIVSSSALILLVLAVRALAKSRLSCRARYALWLLVLVRLLVPAQLFTASWGVAGTALPGSVTEPSVMVMPLERQELPMQEFYNSDTALPIMEGYGPNGSVTVEFHGEQMEITRYAAKWSIADILGAVWLAGAVVLAAVLLASNLRFARRLHRERVPYDALVGGMRVYVAEDTTSPCLVGVLRPTVYLTPECTRDERTLRHVLAHETTHRLHGDCVWSLLRLAALCLHWYNPLVWYAVVVSKRDGELACDEATLARLGDDERVAYGETLLSMVTAKPRGRDLLSASTAMTAGKKPMRERIETIAKHPRTKAAALVLALAVLLTATVFAFSKAEAPEPAPMTEEEALDALEASVEWEHGNVSFTIPEAYEHAEWGILITGRYVDPSDGTVRSVRYYEGEAWQPGARYTIGISNLTELTMQAALVGQRGGLYEREIDLLPPREAETLRVTDSYEVAAHRYQREGWYIYMPEEPALVDVSYYVEDFDRYIYAWAFDGDIIERIIITKTEYSVSELLDMAEEEGFTVDRQRNRAHIESESDGFRGDRFCYEAPDGSSYEIVVNDGGEYYDVLCAMAASFTVETEPKYAPPRPTAEELAAYGIVYDERSIEELPRYPLGKLALYVLGSDGAYAEGAIDELYLRYLRNPEEVAAYLDSLAEPRREALYGFIAGQRAMDKAAFETAFFESIAGEYWFLSGAGGWHTELTIAANGDGTFTGEYSHGSERSAFSGRFGDVTCVNDTYSMRLRELDANAYGIEGADEVLVYLPGTPVDALPEEFVRWYCAGLSYGRSQIGDTLPTVGLYNVNEQYGWFARSLIDTGWEPLSADDLAAWTEALRPEYEEERRDENGSYSIVQASIVSCFLTTHYDSPRYLDLEKFLTYFPTQSVVDEAELDALRAVYAGSGWTILELQELPVPVHRYRVADINAALTRYAGITLDDMSTDWRNDERMLYLPEYDAFYNFTSDWGPGMFVPERGEHLGSVVRLYSDHAALQVSGTPDSFRIMSLTER